MIPVLGYAPDADPSTPGVLPYVENVMPTTDGVRAAPSLADSGAAALAARCRGAVVAQDLSANRRVYAGTSTKLYELTGSTSWTDRTRAVGGDYALGTDDRWSFAQFGNSTLAATPTAVIQRSTGGAFANVSGSPQAKIIVAASGFVVAFNTSSNADGWYCSAYLDDTDWSLSVATQCVSGRLVGGVGPITAALRFGDDIVVYKATSMWLGRYVGAPAVWQFTQVSNDVGCVGQDAVCDTPFGHIFKARDGLYLFDGTVPRRLGEGVIRDWLSSDADGTQQFKTRLLWDRVNDVVWMFYPRNGFGTVSGCVIYHPATKKWGAAHQSGTQSIDAAIMYISPTLTYGAADGDFGINAYNDAPEVPYDSPFWVSGAFSPAVVVSSGDIKTLTGSPTAQAMIHTSDFGDDEGQRVMRALRMQFTDEPDSAAVYPYYKDSSGAALVSSPQINFYSDGKAPMMVRGRWFRIVVYLNGAFRLTKFRPEIVEAGRR